MNFFFLNFVKLCYNDYKLKNPEWTETINYNALEDKIDNKK